MHGVIPPEGRGPLPAAAAPGLARHGGGGAAGAGLWTPKARRATRRGTSRRAPPFPAAALGAATLVGDIAAIALAGILLGGSEVTGFRPGAGAILFLALVMPCLAAAAGSLMHPALFGGRRAALGALASLAAGAALLWAAGLALGDGRALPLGVALLWVALAAPLLLAGRLVGGTALRALDRSSRRRAVLVVGRDGLSQAARLAARLAARQDRSFRLLGTVTEEDEGSGPQARRPRVGDLAELGGIDDLIAMIRRDEVEEVVLALPWSAEARILRLLDLLRECPVDIRLAPEPPAYRGPCGWRPGRPEAGGLVLPRLVWRPIGGVGGLVKALEDRLLAVAALAILAVPMGLIALAIRLDSPGPALFRQRRTGFNDRDFHVLKFRTMYVEHTDHEARCQVRQGDRRVTRIGALLRRTSLDELPQIFNVLRGEMSIVGPRPHAPGTLAGGRPFEEVVARYAARHRVKPGLTGLAQVRGWRGPTETEEKLIRRVESDLEYIESWSLWLDFAILLRTLLAVARMRNAL